MLFIVFLVEILIAVFLFALLQKRSYNFSKRWKSALLGVSVIVLFTSAGLVAYSLGQLKHFSTFKSWRSVDGQVTASEVVGKRAFRPDIQYSYEVNGISYSGRSTLDMPGFGGRINRLQMAEMLAKTHSVGARLTVYYNPDEPQQSRLIIHPPYSVYLKLATGIILLPIAGATLLLLLFAGKSNTEAEEK